MTFEELHANPVEAPVSETVETETTEESTPEPQTTEEPTEEAPADASEQPEESTEEQPRAQKRIQELVRKNKELEAEKAAYWDQLSAKVPEAPTEENEDGVVTVDAIADAVLRKQQAMTIEERRTQAAVAMQQDAAAALDAYPVLENDDELADIVVGYAQKNKLSFKAAADRVIGRITQEKQKVEKKVIAGNGIKVGSSTPTGAKVSTGQMAPPNLSNMSEEEKQANWEQILASMA